MKKTRKKTANETAAHDRVALILARYDAALSKSSLPAKESKEFRKRIDLFRRCFDDCAEFIEFMRADMPNRLDKTYSLIDNLVGSSFLLGSAAALSDDVKKYHQGRATKKAQEARSIKAAPNRKMVEEAILAEAAERNKKIIPKGPAFAILIHPAVLERYRTASGDRESTYPSDSTIRNVIDRMREAKSSRGILKKAKS